MSWKDKMNKAREMQEKKPIKPIEPIEPIEVEQEETEIEPEPEIEIPKRVKKERKPIKRKEGTRLTKAPIPTDIITTMLYLLDEHRSKYTRATFLIGIDRVLDILEEKREEAARNTKTI